MGLSCSFPSQPILEYVSTDSYNFYELGSNHTRQVNAIIHQYAQIKRKVISMKTSYVVVPSDTQSKTLAKVVAVTEIMFG